LRAQLKAVKQKEAQEDKAKELPREANEEKEKEDVAKQKEAQEDRAKELPREANEEKEKEDIVTTKEPAIAEATQESQDTSSLVISIKTVTTTQLSIPPMVTQSPNVSGKSKHFFEEDNVEEKVDCSKELTMLTLENPEDTMEKPEDTRKTPEKPPAQPTEKHTAKFEWFSKKEKDNTEELIERLKDNDPILHQFLLAWGREVCGKRGSEMFNAALLGIYCKHPVEVLSHYMGMDPESVVPPMQKKKNSQEFTASSDDFKDLAMECLRVMEIFLKSCEYGGVSPDRWLWDFILCSLLEDLEEEELYKRSPDRDAFAKLVCLVLSGNTKDETCILVTRELAKKGLLDVNALADADLETIKKIILPGGYYNKRAEFLKQMSQGIRANYGGKVPESLLAIWLSMELPEKLRCFC
jgi:HhH-GPD superfamily base excision DNA repair protein